VLEQQQCFGATASGRLDKILTAHLGVSRNQVEKLIREGLVRVNDATIVKTSYRVEKGDRVTFCFREAERRQIAPVDFDVEVLYEDEVMMVVNKPAGLVVHPAPSVKEPTLVDWLIERDISLSTISGEERHGIVHRIDKETTGALVIAKTNAAHEHLSLQLQDKSMGRYYLALIDCPLKHDVLIDQPIGRSPHNRLKMGIVPQGKPAKTAFIKLAQARVDGELIAAKLFTGRTHQIRVHLASMGRHILGDDLYGFKSKKATISRVYLHAYLLYLTHPSSNKQVTFKAPLFDDMKRYFSTQFEQSVIDANLDADAIAQRFEALLAH
jgi:23S rRNA pseudouridine1911/1915/1917 synthase